MEIYGELLFAENLIAGYLILKISARWINCTVPVIWFVTGSIMCALYSFTVFAPLSGILQILMKIMFSLVAVHIVFFRHKVRVTAFLKAVSVFYIVSFITGGCAMAIICAAGISGVWGNGGIYTDNITYFKIYAALFISYILAEICIKAREERSYKRNVEISVGDIKWKGTGMIDTGNTCMEPATGRIVHIISAKGGEKLKLKPESSRFIPVFFKTVGQEKSMMEGYIPDALYINGKKSEKCIVAVSRTEMREGYDILLNRNVMEGSDDKKMD